jgi:hypothetical protein
MNSQLELRLKNSDSSHPAIRRQRQLRRAKWWFHQMRQTVERALDHQPIRRGRPKQIDFALGSQS